LLPEGEPRAKQLDHLGQAAEIKECGKEWE